MLKLVDEDVTRVEIVDVEPIKVLNDLRWTGKARFPGAARARAFVVFQLGNDVVAISALCPHEQANLSMSAFPEPYVIECPLHGQRYDLRTGAIKTFQVQLDGERMYLLWRRSTKEPVSANFTSQVLLEHRSDDERVETLERELVALRTAGTAREAHMVETLRQMDAMVREAEDGRAAVQASHAQLANANAFITSVTQSMGEVLMVLDLEGCVRDVNHRYTSLLGFTRPQVTGRRFASLVADPAEDERLMRGQIEGSLDGALLNAEGERVPHLLRIAPIYGAGGKREGAVVVGTDIRLLRQAQREVERAYEKVSDLLNHMQQAVFVVLANGEIVDPVSRYASVVFGDDISGRNVFDVLYRDLPRESEAFVHLELAFHTCFGAEDFQWDLMSELFVRRIVRKAEPGRDDDVRILKVEYNPLRDSEGLMNRLMVVVEDITKVELLEREKRVGERRTQILEELVRNRLEDLGTFFGAAYEQLRDARRMLERDDRESHVVLFRQLHTLKGNARVLGLTLIAQATHEVETLATQLREGGTDTAPRVASVREGISAVRRTLAEYGDVATRILHLRNDLEAKSLADLHQATIALDAELARLLANPGSDDTPSRARALKELAAACRDAAEAGGSDEVRLAAKALDETLLTLLDGSSASWTQALATLPEQRAALNDQAIQRRLGSSAVGCYTLATATWTSLYLDVYALTAAFDRLRRGDDGERHLAELELAHERATIAATSLHAEYVPALLRLVGDAIVAPTNEQKLENALRELWRHLSLHSVLETYALLRPDERQLLSHALCADTDGELVDLLESGSIRMSTFVAFLTALSRRKVGLREVFGLLSPLLARQGTAEMAASFVCTREHEPHPSLPEALDASGRAHDIDGWLAQLGIPASSYKATAALDLHYLMRLDALRLVQAVRELMAGQFQSLFEPVQTLEVMDFHYKELRRRLAEFKAGRDESALAALETVVAQLLHVPLIPAFHRYYTMVSEIATRLGKSVRLHVHGESGASLPRERLASLSDALVHLLRNALDHGIETPEERRLRGKPELGSLQLVATSLDDMLCIHVCDDGRGIDPERVKKKALEMGLLDEQAAAKLSPREAVELVFLPHFSTAGQVTDISGRGIGMDVVRESLAQIGATISIDTRVGRGTTFTIMLDATP